MFPLENRKKKKPWWHDLAQYKIPKRKKDDMKYVLLLLYLLNKKNKKGKKNVKKNSFTKNFSPHLKKTFKEKSYSQRCVIRMTYADDKKKHLDFVNKYMIQLNKKDVIDKPSLFSDEEVTKEYLEKYEKRVDDRFFRFRICPEKNGLDLQLLTRQLIKKMEAYMQRPLDYLAVIHKDTEHHHVHLCINGVDKNGKKIERIPKELITKDMRIYAQEIITSQIGFRSKAELLSEMNKMYAAYRFTKLDKTLESKQIFLGNNAFDKWKSLIRFSTTEEKKRLETLEKIGLAQKKKDSVDCYYLEKNWKEKLLAANNHNTFFKARTELKNVSPENLTLYKKDEEVRGVVTKIYFPNQEDSWKGAYIVENQKQNKAWYVPVPSNKDPLKAMLGKTVTIKAKTLQNGFTFPVVFEHENK